MKNITRTIWGAALQSSQLPGLPYATPPKTTLNELYNVQSGVQPPGGKLPALGYLAIGNGAHIAAVGANNFPLMVTAPHYSTDSALFKGVPFAMRPLTADFSAQQMAGYAMRVVQAINGTQYACYYLKRIDKTGLATAINYNTVVNGQVTTQPYNATTGNLNPVRPNVSPTGVVTTSADYLTVGMVLDLGFSANDVAEFLNVATILYGSAQYGVISELAICSGLDATVQGQGVSGSFAYNEAIAVQVHSFVTTFMSVSDTDQGFEFDVDLGAAEPLLTANSGTTTSQTQVGS